MQLLPITIKKYKTDADSECFIRKVRANTIYQYNEDGYVRDYNPNDLLYRNEKVKGIYLKDQSDLKTRYGGGTTAIFISDSDNGKTIITTIAYFGWQQSLVLVLFIIGLLYTIFYSSKDTMTVVIGLVIFLILFALTSSKALIRQKDLIEKIIESCVAEK